MIIPIGEDWRIKGSKRSWDVQRLIFSQKKGTSSWKIQGYFGRIDHALAFTATRIIRMGPSGTKEENEAYAQSALDLVNNAVGNAGLDVAVHSEGPQVVLEPAVVTEPRKAGPHRVYLDEDTDWQTSDLSGRPV